MRYDLEPGSYVGLPGLQRSRLRKYLNCEEFHTDLRCSLPLRQPGETWAATISREIRCDRVLQLLNEHLAKDPSERALRL